MANDAGKVNQDDVDLRAMNDRFFVFGDLKNVRVPPMQVYSVMV